MAEMNEKPNDYTVGQRVRLLANIWDDGADHHPPGWMAHRGEILIVRKIGGMWPLYISHESITGRSFGVQLDEVVRA